MNSHRAEVELAWRYLEAESRLGVRAQSYEGTFGGGTPDIEAPMAESVFLAAVDRLRTIDSAIATLPPLDIATLTRVGEGRTWGPALIQAYGRPSGLCLAGLAATLPSAAAAWRAHQVKQGRKRIDLDPPGHGELRAFLQARAEHGDRRATAPVRAEATAVFVGIVARFADALRGAARDAA